MNIEYRNPGFEHSLNSILLFQTDDQTPFWSDSLLHFYPQIDRKELMGRSLSHKKQYLSEILYGVYQENKRELDDKAIRCNLHFLNHKDQIEDALSEAFDLDSRSLFNDLSGNITLNPVCPRFLQERYFDIFYLNSEKGALGLSLHEVIHYFWFSVWNAHFGDSYEDYESPSLKWILSEMAVEPIMRDQRLSSINPYFPREHGGCVYPYFQNMLIDGDPILDTLDTYYRSRKITAFMEDAFHYCLKHEQAIRHHINAAETA